MKPHPKSFAIPIHFNPVTECNNSDMGYMPPVTNRNISNMQGATKRNIMNMLPATICNKTELKRTKPPLMTEHVNYKALKMNTTPQPKNTIFETHQKFATKRNKAELNRTKILYHQGKPPGSTVVLRTIGDTTEASGVTCTRPLFLCFVSFGGATSAATH